ncbi:acyltransferase family protein [Salinisphaera orenii]|nr:acyltransferase family protein [Salinisphaera orenii]
MVPFFVLSGFVLQLMLEGGRLTYGAYAARRILRFYLPYIVAVELGIAGQQWRYGGDLAGLGDWINRFWTDDPGPRAMLGHFTVIGAFDSSTYDFAIWTLVHEMRISLLFPLVFLMIRCLRWRTVLGGFGLASLIMARLRIGVFSGHDELAGLARDGGYTAYVFTVHHLLAFAIGGPLADRRERLAAIQAGLPARTRALLLALGLTLDIYGARR